MKASSFKRLFAVTLVLILALSLSVPAFASSETTPVTVVCTKGEDCAAESHEADCPKAAPAPVACTKAEDCAAESHEADCPKAAPAPVACTKAEDCAAESHEADCPKAAPAPVACTKAEDCAAESHEEGCPKAAHAPMVCTKTEGCILADGHEGECVVAAQTELEKLQDRINALPDEETLRAMSLEELKKINDEVLAISVLMESIKDTEGFDTLNTDKLMAVAALLNELIMTLENTEKLLTVVPDQDAVEGSQYKTIQDAINYIGTQEDKEGWTIEVAGGSYGRFTVLDGMHGLTVKAAEGAAVSVSVCDNSAPPVPASGGAPDTAGVSVRAANNVSLQGLSFEVDAQGSPRYSAAVSNYSESAVKGDKLTVSGCTFNGSGSGIGVFINSGTTSFNVNNCYFGSLKEAVSMYGDGTLLAGADVSGNSFAGCSFAIHGYYGGSGNGGVLNFTGNTVTGGDTYCKVVIQDQLNTGAIKANISGNSLTNAIVGLVNLREAGETVSPVLSSNTFNSNSFYVEAIEPGTIDFYTSYQAPNSEGYWVLTGKEDFDVDWGKNPDGSTAKIEDLIQDANASGSHVLNITGIDEANLIKTFTWFKDGLYWVSGEQPKPPYVPPVPDPEDGVSRSKTASNLDENFLSKVTLSLPSAEEPLVSDIVFVLDKSTSAALEDQALEMLSELQTRIAGNNAQVRVGVVIFNKEAHQSGFYDLGTQYADIEAAIKQEIKSGTNTHAGLLAGKAMLDADTAVDASRKYLIFVSDGITYMYNAEPTATAWSFMADSVRNFAGPDNYNSKYGSNEPPADWNLRLGEIERQVVAQGTKYEYPYGGTVVEVTPVEEQAKYANSVDKALYLTYKTYYAAAEAGYNCYAMNAATNGSANAWGPSFMSFLANGRTVSFETIKNDILYLVDSGSYVKDFIGYVDGDYDFDFVNKAEAMTLKVGDASYNAEKITDNEYGFKPVAGGYAYTLEYVRGDGKGGEHFIWHIYEPVTNFAPVQLTYTVLLTNPKDEPGSYGIYDWNGSNPDAEELYTNNSAVLYPVDSNGNEGDPQEFPKPTVSYEVIAKPVDITVTKVWDDKQDADGFRPDSVTVRLLANGKDTGKSLTLSGENKWTGGFTGLDSRDENNQPIKYTVSEDRVKFYTTVITNANGSETDFVITNKHNVDHLSIPVVKVWNDDDDIHNRRPGSVMVYLYANGEPTGDKLIISEKEGWRDSFDGLPMYSNGQPIKYSIRERSMYFYDGKVSADDNGGFVVTNTYTTSPRTGDTSNIGLWAGLAGLSLVVIGAAIVMIRKKNKRN